jgi:hypothetical protein
MCFSFACASLSNFNLAERQARHCHVDAVLNLFNLFLFPSIRGRMKRGSQASRDPLRSAAVSILKAIGYANSSISPCITTRVLTTNTATEYPIGFD